MVNEDFPVLKSKGNMTTIRLAGGTLLFSYETLVAFSNNDGVAYVRLIKGTPWSKTTMSHVNAFTVRAPSASHMNEELFAVEFAAMLDMTSRLTHELREETRTPSMTTPDQPA